MNKELIKEVETLIREVNETHRYSMSRIYGLSNRIFDKNETPQSCATCLLRKVAELKKWLEAEKRKELEKTIGRTSSTKGNYETVSEKKTTKRKRKEA